MGSDARKRNQEDGSDDGGSNAGSSVFDLKSPVRGSLSKMKPLEPLDAKRLGDLMSVKNGLENNIPGKSINGTMMKPPQKLYSNQPRSDSSMQEEPDVKDLDLLH